MKPGYKTTEFWVSALTTGGALIGALAGALPGTAGIVAASISGGLYAVSRGLAKLTNGVGSDI